ncbi:MAG: methyltransferase domain-containing protein [Chloroflexi bacterium]|nr:methyltransferase domain-containing protein [Chloroflexota bacterium]
MLNEILACSMCHTSLAVTDKDVRVVCARCLSSFRKGAVIWNFMPTQIDLTAPRWQAWQELQKNGMTSYHADPEHNLAIGERVDCQQFAEFCDYRGLVLDVGCGPQPVPAYFDLNCPATYVGIDPLINDVPTHFLKLKALGEFLPFRADVFDQIIFATTLDHFVDAIAALKEAARVCGPTGVINVWLGEKRADASKPALSHEWYRRLHKPTLAEDVFHFKRLDAVAFAELARIAGLKMIKIEEHHIDDFRTNWFYRLKAG